MSDFIEASPAHGLNPSLGVCFWCGEETGEIALVGRIHEGPEDDAKAPHYTVVSYEPCDSCKQLFDMGVLLAEVSETPESPNQPPIQEGLYPTGKYAVVTEEGVLKMFDPEAAQNVLEAGRAFLDEEAFALFEKATALAGADQ